MKSVYSLALAFIVTVAVVGCGGPQSNQLSTDTATAEDIAKYEADLAAANSGEGYDEGTDEE